jgi:thiol-disulfide isomerase/thioredoxin
VSLRRALSSLLTGLALAAAAGCGGSSGGGAVPSAKVARTQLAGAPAPLSTLHRQANDLLPGGTSGFRRRLASLRGHPVIVNKWASWCAPCRYEFPVLQRMSVKHGKQVAFLGIDARDDRGGATRYLREHPVSYPSYVDPREQVSRVIRAPEGFPITVFYDRAGKLVFQHAGPYTSDTALERDITKYLG